MVPPVDLPPEFASQVGTCANNGGKRVQTKGSPCKQLQPGADQAAIPDHVSVTTKLTQFETLFPTNDPAVHETTHCTPRGKPRNTGSEGTGAGTVMFVVQAPTPAVNGITARNSRG